ncbi:MAG: ABC transporter permease [Lentisphaeria bacterium]|nr:ABC transporter permease [Lentisphaeria bacterium]
MKTVFFTTLLLFEISALSKSDFYLAAAGIFIAAAVFSKRKFSNVPARQKAAADIGTALLMLLLLWQLSTRNFKLLDPVLFPTPESVLKLFFSELPEMTKGMLSSLYLLGSAYFLALVTAIPAGLWVGSSNRLRNMIEPFSKVLSAIPPIVYIPYAIALLPSFDTASIFVIYSGVFWPVFVSTVSGVVNIPETLLDSARMLNLKRHVFCFHILLPGAMPSILTGASLGLIFSFLLLTAAELIGATEGLGWYVKNYSDFADYARVIVGILFIGLVITVISTLFRQIEKILLRYREVKNG